uniref:Uncharacterized protein n=1 Tax=Anguilla anguilla TaxID=7936 RepID=A0A0E9SSA4_ANGAN
MCARARVCEREREGERECVCVLLFVLLVFSVQHKETADTCQHVQ